jgi:hypothetical protein
VPMYRSTPYWRKRPLVPMYRSTSGRLHYKRKRPIFYYFYWKFIYGKANRLKTVV